MAKEIEHKYLVANDNWRNSIKKRIHILDALIFSKNTGKLRIRITDNKATLALKTKRILNYRDEYEYEIPYNDAIKIIETNSNGRIIEKYRNFIIHEKHIWEVDEYVGLLKGTIIAEIELNNFDEKFTKPEWVGEEITNNERYRIINMINNKIEDNWNKNREKMTKEAIGEYLFPKFSNYN